MCHLCEIRRLVGYWLRTCFYSYKFLFSVSAALLADHRHTHRSTSTAVTTRTAINSAIPQGTRFYRDLCTTPFGISSRWEDILSKDAALVPSSNHLVRATLPCRWWATTGIRTPHARTLAHGKHPSCIVLSCTRKYIYTMWQEYLGLTKQSHWLYLTGLRCFCSKSTSYATLLWRWSATAGIRIPHARTLAHGKHPSDTELFCARNSSTMLRRWGLVGTRM